MSEFSVLYRSLHQNQKVKKSVEKNDSTSETKTTRDPDTPLNLFRTIIQKIF